MRKSYSKKQRIMIIKKYLSGKMVTELSSEYRVSRCTVYKWIHESPCYQKQERQINMRDFFELKRRCQQQEQMIEILQNAPYTVNSPLQERYDYILSCSEKYSINLLCRTIKVAKGSYYSHILRCKNENTIFEEKKKELTPIIEEIFHDNNQI